MSGHRFRVLFHRPEKDKKFYLTRNNASLSFYYFISITNPVTSYLLQSVTRCKFPREQCSESTHGCLVTLLAASTVFVHFQTQIRHFHSSRKHCYYNFLRVRPIHGQNGYKMCFSWCESTLDSYLSQVDFRQIHYNVPDKNWNSALRILIHRGYSLPHPRIKALYSQAAMNLGTDQARQKCQLYTQSW